ncbi:DUF3592 domain-containing protein [Flavobacterium sp. '19STA2R22 D10 B1']|uniref:DUF3592 domain-containing protein n=1 Tax=Flavobacterium aerium TaxID=3037261 RepID=UPI00278C744F|nr:DUF3592 domain-containing protein [Flavobacterium sp. '19STA2R22 D10 B1']
MKKFTVFIVVILFTVVSCKNEDNLEWPKTSGIITGMNDTTQMGNEDLPEFNVKFKDKNGKEVTGMYDADTSISTPKIGDSVEFYYDPEDPTLLYNEEIYNEMQSEN